MDDNVWHQATLPIKYGGFGLSLVQTVAQSAFLASWAHTLKELPIRFPGMKPVVGKVVMSSPPAGYLCQTLNSVLPQNHFLSDMLTDTKKLQHKLSAESAKAEAIHLIENATSLRDGARFRSLQGKGAGSWLSAIPTSGKLALKPCEFRLTAYLRLGLSLPLCDNIQACDCGKVASDSSGYHQMVCKTGGGPVWTHDSITSVWSECLNDLKIHHRKEPKDRYATSDSRPDIVVFDTGVGSNVELDISLAHPWSSDIFPTSASKDGAAASKREDRKVARYERERYPGGLSVRVVPLVVEHFGRWGKKAEAYLDDLSKRSRDGFGRLNRAEFKDYWRKRLSIQLQRCNASVLLRKVSNDLQSQEVTNDYLIS